VSPGYGWWVMNMVLETKKPPKWVVFSAFGMGADALQNYYNER